MKYYDEFLNKKSILDCESEKDIQQHNNEINKIFDVFQTNAKAGAVLEIKYTDLGHRGDKSEYMYISTEDFRKAFDGLNTKNGVDFSVYKDICAVVYGQNYTLYNSKEECMEEAVVGFRFIDETQAEHIETVKNCLDFIDDVKLKNEFLSIVYRMDDFFIDSTKLVENIKQEIDTSLDAKINRAKANKHEFSTEKTTIDFER